MRETVEFTWLNTIILLVSALIPAIILMRYVYTKDKQEKEPIQLLLKLVFYGVLAAIISSFLELVVAEVLLSNIPPSKYVLSVILDAFTVGLIEEGMKFYYLKKTTWDNENFNFRFDGIVYAVFISLGFAGFENIFYVMEYGLSVAFARALMSVPGHMSFAVLMGVFYGNAKLDDVHGFNRKCKLNLVLAYLSAVLIHGLYDTAAMMGTVASFAALILLVIIMYFMSYRLLKTGSNQDTRIY